MGGSAKKSVFFDFFVFTLVRPHPKPHPRVPPAAAPRSFKSPLLFHSSSPRGAAFQSGVSFQSLLVGGASVYQVFSQCFYTWGSLSLSGGDCIESKTFCFPLLLPMYLFLSLTISAIPWTGSLRKGPAAIWQVFLP